jgi:hypothetical protein
MFRDRVARLSKYEWIQVAGRSRERGRSGPSERNGRHGVAVGRLHVLSRRLRPDYVCPCQIRRRVQVRGSSWRVRLPHDFAKSGAHSPWEDLDQDAAAHNDADFRAVAPDMRAYGQTESPESIEQFTLFHLSRRPIFEGRREVPPKADGNAAAPQATPLCRCSPAVACDRKLVKACGGSRGIP